MLVGIELVNQLVELEVPLMPNIVIGKVAFIVVELPMNSVSFTCANANLHSSV